MTLRLVPRHDWPNGASLSDDDVKALHSASHGDPARALGWQELERGLVVVRTWHPALEAEGEVLLVLEGEQFRMERRCAWLYEVVLEGAGDLPSEKRVYSVDVKRHESNLHLYDPYGFNDGLAMTGDEEITEIQNGFSARIGDTMGCHCLEVKGIWGVRFSVWAPTSTHISVVGDFNSWDGRALPMKRRWILGGFTGFWDVFMPCSDKREHIPFGNKYSYKIKGANGSECIKIDPYGQEFEVPPKYSSVITGYNDASGYVWGDADFLEKRKKLAEDNAFRREPMAIYEVHLPSWRRGLEGEILNYRVVAPLLVEHMLRMNFNWVELMPLNQHPFSGSWGYQATGMYAVYSMMGTPDDFKFFVDTMHQAEIGVIMDFVPAHFCQDAWALMDYDGSATYEYQDPREGLHKEWGTRVYNFRRNEVRAFLLGTPIFWTDKYHIDGYRFDAVSAMLYRNHMRKAGEWIPNENGGDSNLEAMSLLREFNQRLHECYPGIVTAAEESTSWSGITQSLDHPSGLGFDFKWDLGWMNDTLSYLAAPAHTRPGKHEKVTFRGLYMQHERWVLPLSHDEIVNGKGSLMDKMSYMDNPDFFDKIQLLKTLFGWQVGNPGRPLIMMGSEFGQGREWDYDKSLDWHEAGEDLRSKVCMWVSDLLGTYRYHKVLHAGDDHPFGVHDLGLDIPKSFEWTEVDNRQSCTVAFVRTYHREDPVFIVCNFSPTKHGNYAFGLPMPGKWKCILNSDDWRYGGRGEGPGNNSELFTTPDGAYGWPACLRFDVPAYGCLLFLGVDLECMKPPEDEAATPGEAALEAAPPGEAALEAAPPGEAAPEAAPPGEAALASATDGTDVTPPDAAAAAADG